MNGVERIALERERQIEDEGWTPEHDDRHAHEQLARAAACYALPHDRRQVAILDRSLVSWIWPWSQRWWKPTVRPGDQQDRVAARIRELEKAGALCAAEIDRLLRLG